MAERGGVQEDGFCGRVGREGGDGGCLGCLGDVVGTRDGNCKGRKEERGIYISMQLKGRNGKVWGNRNGE